jgi:DNA-binding XRE family transcriptional regulator
MNQQKYQPNQLIDPKVIKELRDKLDLKQSEMAEIIGCNRSELSLIENGKLIPDWLERFIRLSRLMSEAGYSWEDVVMKFPEPATPRASEQSAEYQYK